jgi:hypothetical protein
MNYLKRKPVVPNLNLVILHISFSAVLLLTELHEYCAWRRGNFYGSIGGSTITWWGRARLFWH